MPLDDLLGERQATPEPRTGVILGIEALENREYGRPAITRMPIRCQRT